MLVSSGDNWHRTIDGDENSSGTSCEGAEAIFAFKDEQPATFETFSVLIPNTGINLKELELAAGNDSPTGQFRSIGKFQTQNVKFMKSPYQEFKFPAVTAKYLKVKLLSGHGNSCFFVYELQLLGTLQKGD